jgi:flagellar biosynthetic protein FliQ
MDLLLEHVKAGLYLVLILSMPAVFVAAAIGLVVGILQAVTQVQEQTLAAAPKIVLVFLVVIFGGELMMTMLETFMKESAVLAFEEIPSRDAMVLPARHVVAQNAGPLSRAQAMVRHQQSLPKPTPPGKLRDLPGTGPNAAGILDHEGG